MKVLFAVSNENISESIVKKYQKDYKEIVSYKNVYYFNAILKEIQRDKSYDRIVISEDLEPFANNDYEAIDRFIFEKLDSISDEATDAEGGDTPIILICSDRRAKSESLLVKLFGIGIYNALLGQDRSIDQVCNLIKKPRTKKEAKIYYKIEADDVNYQSENEDSVSEVEIQNIRTHYKRLGKNEEAYVDSFNNIAAQYSDAQLRVIVKFLPLNVRAVLETQSPKYQSIMTFTGPVNKGNVKKEETKKENGIKIDFIENQLNKPKLNKPVIVPSAVNTNNVKKLNKVVPKPVEESINEPIQQPLQDMVDDVFEEIEPIVEQPKRGRGRPKKMVEPQEESVNAFDLEEEDEELNKIDTMLPGFEQEEELEEINPVLPGFEQEEETPILPGFDEEDELEQEPYSPPSYQPQAKQNETTEYRSYQSNQQHNYQQDFTTGSEITNTSYQNTNIESLLTRDKKIVSFVGTTKNGSSFLVNNLAELFSSMGINVAILDATKNKNSYFIYTKNEEELRRVAFNCMENLERGMPEGIKVNKNLTVYTSLPTEPKTVNYEAVLSTLVRNYSLVLIDCDFFTPLEYFENSQEIYLVQSMDILTIQPLTAFLRDLKAKNILSQEKIRIVINKQARVRSLNAKVVIGGMAFYNDPSMSFMTELFNKDSVKYVSIPFDEQVYAKYLEGLVNCKISINGYPKNFMAAFKELGNMVYPLLNAKYKPVETYEKKNAFSSNMSDTLEQMKKKY